MKTAESERMKAAVAAMDRTMRETRERLTERDFALIQLRRAGYDGDRSRWTRIALAHNIGDSFAQAAWTAGKRVRMAENETAGVEAQS
jgi:hypothetical protein